MKLGVSLWMNAWPQYDASVSPVPPAGGERSDLRRLLPLLFTDDLSFGVLDVVCSITKINCLKIDYNYKSITFSCFASSSAIFFSVSSAFALARSRSLDYYWLRRAPSSAVLPDHQEVLLQDDMQWYRMLMH
jgi:hypothetical protein